MSVKPKFFPPDELYKILDVACPTLGFFVFAEKTIPTNCAVALIAGIKSLFQADCVL